jgi:hypothetical protein
MAYATVAGQPVEIDLYTAFIPLVIYALLGSSRVRSVSSTTTLAILAGTQLGLTVPDGDPARLITATATLTALVGVMLLVARLLRLGFIANFISTPVLTGFKAGRRSMPIVNLSPPESQMPTARCSARCWPAAALPRRWSCAPREDSRRRPRS